VYLFAIKTSNTVDLMSTVVLFHLNTVRHVKCVRKMRWQDMWHVWGRRGTDWVWCINLRDRDHTDDEGINGITVLTF
jgi:hypothetical protein